MASKPKICTYGCGKMIVWDGGAHQYNDQGTNSKHDCSNQDGTGSVTIPKPKYCKYGCGTTIVWNGEFFQGPDHKKHDCRDWDKSAFPVGGVSSGGAVATGGALPVSQQGFATNAYNSAPPPSGETLIALQAKKTWENYFKLLEPILANLAAIASTTEETNKHLIEVQNKIKSLEDTMTVVKAKCKPKEEKENGS